LVRNTIFSDTIYISLYYIVYIIVSDTIHSQSYDVNVISGGIYIFLYYILYNRTTIPILISDTFAIFCRGW